MLHDKESEFWCYLAGGKNARCSIVYIMIRFPCPATVSERLENWASKKMWLIRFYKPHVPLCASKGCHFDNDQTSYLYIFHHLRQKIALPNLGVVCCLQS